jgi:hypothetical protein
MPIKLDTSLATYRDKDFAKADSKARFSESERARF